MIFESRVVMWRIDLKSINMAQGFYFRFFFSFAFREKKKSKSKFWSDGIFGLGRFSIYWVVGLFKSFFFDKRPLNVGRHVENVFYLKDSRDMASL